VPGWPATEIDHHNGNKSDNRWFNLRRATHAENAQNAVLRIDNRSGYKGVNWRPTNGKWQARIQYSGRRVSLGYYDTVEEAHAAYVSAASRLHGEFALCNRTLEAA